MNLNTQAGGSVEVPDAVFGKDFNEPLVHQVVQGFLVNGKTGTKAQKSRAQVNGGGSKPWRQKGTGRARAGTRSSPIWVGGGVTFAAKPLVTRVKVNKKMFRSAMTSMLSELVRQERVVVIEEIELDAPSTKVFKQKLSGFGLDKGLVLVEEMTDNLYLSARNLPNVSVQDVHGIGPVMLAANQKVVVTLGALNVLGEMFG